MEEVALACFYALLCSPFSFPFQISPRQVGVLPCRGFGVGRSTSLLMMGEAMF